MKNGKVSGEDKFTVNICIIKEAGNEVFLVLTVLFNKCITLCGVPKDWKNAIIKLLFKKDEKEDNKNYRSNSLLLSLLKLLLNILTNRL